MLICKVDDYRYSLNQFRAIYQGKDQSGRKIVKHQSAKMIATGEIEEGEWFRTVMDLITAAGEIELLDEIKAHCREHCAWLRNEEQIENHAIECMVDRAYKHWDGMEHIDSERKNVWVFLWNYNKG